VTAATGPRLTFRGVVRAEWAKLTGLRSTWLTLTLVVLFTVGVAAAVGHGVAGAVEGGDPPPSTADAVATAFLPLDFAVLVVAVVGVLQVTGEYPGPIRATLAAVPRRWPVVAAKAVALAALTAPVMALTALGAFLACQAFLGDDGASLADDGVARAVAGAAVCPVLMGLSGLGVGTLVRHTAGAITTLVAMLFVVPLLLGPALPGDREDDVLRFVPTIAGQAMYGVDGSGAPFETLTPGGSALVLLAWTAALLAAGVVALVRRDA
jgi:ABC-2 type transport system permease protein